MNKRNTNLLLDNRGIQKFENIGTLQSRRLPFLERVALLVQQRDAIKEMGDNLQRLLISAQKCVCETPTRHCRGCQADLARALAVKQWGEVAK